MPHYLEALRLLPDSVPTRINYGFWLVSRGRVDEGIEQYRIALDLDPRASAAETNLGLALIIRGDLADAERHFRAALTATRSAWACYHLGDVSMRQGRAEEAAAALEQTLQIDANTGDRVERSGERPASTGAIRGGRSPLPPRDRDRSELCRGPQQQIWACSGGVGTKGRGRRAVPPALAIDPDYSPGSKQSRRSADEAGNAVRRRSRNSAAIAVNPALDLQPCQSGAWLGLQGRNVAAAGRIAVFLRSSRTAQVMGWLAWLLATAPKTGAFGQGGGGVGRAGGGAHVASRRGGLEGPGCRVCRDGALPGSGAGCRTGATLAFGRRSAIAGRGDPAVPGLLSGEKPSRNSAVGQPQAEVRIWCEISFRICRVGLAYGRLETMRRTGVYARFRL